MISLGYIEGSNAMKGSSSRLEDSSYVADFVCEIVPISLVATVFGGISWALGKWCIGTKVLLFKALLGLGGVMFGLLTIVVLGFLAVLALVEFVKGAFKLNQ